VRGIELLFCRRLPDYLFGHKYEMSYVSDEKLYCVKKVYFTKYTYFIITLFFMTGTATSTAIGIYDISSITVSGTYIYV